MSYSLFADGGSGLRAMAQQIRFNGAWHRAAARCQAPYHPIWGRDHEPAFDPAGHAMLMGVTSSHGKHLSIYVARQRALLDRWTPDWSVMAEDISSEIDFLETELHQLDRRLSRMRSELIHKKRGLQEGDPTDEVERLEAEYLALGDQFTEIWTRWNRANS